MYILRAFLLVENTGSHKENHGLFNKSQSFKAKFVVVTENGKDFCNV